MACQWQTRSRGGLYLESTRAEQLGVLPGEDRLVREVMDHRMASPGLRKLSATVREVLSPRQVVTCCENDTVADALLMMEKKRVTTVLVLNEQGSVTGLLSLVDVTASVMPGTATALLSEIRNSQLTAV